MAGLSLLALQQLPETQKTTLYFSLKPLVQADQSPTFDHAESTMKMAEAMAGWAKNPQFREDVAREANVVIHNFKRKLSARKQNYINVFWTLKLHDEERAQKDVVVAALINQINQRFTTLNQDSAAPYAMTKVEVFSEAQNIPTWWLVAFALFLGLGLSLVCVYACESFRARVSFIPQVENLFPGSPVLSVPETLGKHDEKLLERFILSFNAPRLIGTFPASEAHFSLSPQDAIDRQAETPILVIKLGETSLTELKNLRAIFGQEVGLIIFHR